MRSSPITVFHLTLTLVCVVFFGLSGSLPAWSDTTTPLDSKPFNDPHLEAYKETPLKSRMPLVLIHGIGPEKGDYYNWATYLEFLKDKTEFNQRYKIYFFHFNPKKSIDETAHDLIKSITHFKQVYGIKKLRVVALSQGGLIFRRAYDNPEIQALSDKVITIGAPFHGTPLANRSWMKEGLKQRSFLSPLPYTLRIVYHFVRKKSPHFEADYCWDNLDQGLSPEVNGHHPLQCHATDQANQYKHAPFITYASFFGLHKKEQAYLLKQLNLELKLPKEQSAFLLSRARAFNFTQNKIEKMPLVNVPKKDDTIYPIMLYNDGVVPIGSALWLGRFQDLETIDADTDIDRQRQLWNSLIHLKNKRTARLFPGIDHQNWMLNATRTHSKKVRDLLNPDEPERSVFNWLLQDLMTD